MQIILYSIIAGICGTGLGGLITALLGRSSDRATCVFLSFAGGIMTSIVCFGLVPEARQEADVFMVTLGLILGILIIMMLNRLVDVLTDKKSEKLKLHTTPEELYHENGIIAANPHEKLLKSGILMFLAIGLHNIPEGLAIGAGGSHNLELGLMMTIMIAVHNIPEGMAIAAPLIAGGLSKRRVVLLTVLSGTPTILGAALGILVGNISSTAIALSLAGAGGAMLYVVFGEIVPQTVTMSKSRISTIVILIGMLAGLLLTALTA